MITTGAIPVAAGMAPKKSTLPINLPAHYNAMPKQPEKSIFQVLFCAQYNNIR
ncbi:MAG: hypothetical protein HW387_1169 [Parachlamydiales bacterium]|nr:hypothetical protein [Parachlamydiales bacterium]